MRSCTRFLWQNAGSCAFRDNAILVLQQDFCIGSMLILCIVSERSCKINRDAGFRLHLVLTTTRCIKLLFIYIAMLTCFDYVNTSMLSSIRLIFFHCYADSHSYYSFELLHNFFYRFKLLQFSFIVNVDNILAVCQTFLLIAYFHQLGKYAAFLAGFCPRMLSVDCNMQQLCISGWFVLRCYQQNAICSSVCGRSENFRDTYSMFIRCIIVFIEKTECVTRCMCVIVFIL